MNIKEREKDYLVYLLWLFGVIPSNILKNYIVVKSPTLRWKSTLFDRIGLLFYKPESCNYRLTVDLS